MHSHLYLEGKLLFLQIEMVVGSRCTLELDKIKSLTTLVLQHIMCCVYAKLPRSCPTLCDPIDCSLSGFSVHETLQARIPEWVANVFEGIFLTQEWKLSFMSPALAGGLFTTSATWKAS